MAVALAWSGGKDAALALHALRADGVEPVALLTTVSERSARVTVHEVRRELLHQQAAAIGIPLVEVPIPDPCPNDVYGERMATALATPPLDAIDAIAFGDLLHADIRAWREQRLAAATPPRQALFPLWGVDTAVIARRFLDAGFAATVTAVDARALDRSFAGRAYDDALLAALPAGVDPCGEHGEFHTFVHAGPIFDAPIPIAVGAIVARGDLVCADLRPAVATR